MLPAAVQIRPLPVFCVIEHEHRDRAVAEAVRDGWFSHVGITLKLGLRPDWLTAQFPRDEEWRIEWSKFYYGLDLASAFCETGDSSFLHAWEDLVESWIEQVSIDFDSSDVIARRIQNWIYAWNIFQRDKRFADLNGDLAERIAVSIRDQAAYLRQNLSPERNHRTLELYALFVSSLALPEIDENRELFDFSIAELCRNLLSDIRVDGVHREHSTHYHMIALRSFIGARKNAELQGLSLPPEYDQRLERACEFAMHCHRPDGAIPALSDSDSGSYLDVLQLAADSFGRADFSWIVTRGREGKPPDKKYSGFEEGGYFFQRSGWGGGLTDFEDERFLVFDCGSLGDGGHGHYDALSVEIASGGKPLIVDPGRYTYHEGTPNLRQWFKGTAAHNTVCVDGLDQTPYRGGKPKGEVAQARLIERLSAPNFDLICGRVESPCYEATHTRFVFFIADEYWVIVDQLRGELPHDYDLRFHLAPEALNHVSVHSDAGNHAVFAPGVALVFPANQKPGLQAGWFAPKYGEKLAAPVVSVRADGTANTDFFTLIAPNNFDDLPASLSVIESADRISFVVSGVGPERAATDFVVWSAMAERFQFGRCLGSAHATWRRASAWEASSVLRACRVYQLGAAELAQHARPLPWLLCDDHGGVTLADGRPL